MQPLSCCLCLTLPAAQVIESVGWTKGSLHMKTEAQPWYVSSMLDMAVVLLLGIGAVLAAVGAALVAVVRFAARKLRQRRSGGLKKQL